MADLDKRDCLLPCPFCGGQAEELRCPGGSFVRCPACRASSDDSRAVEAWNRRIPPAYADARRAAGGVIGGKALYDLIYAHAVIKYDPAAGERCAAKALADAYRAGSEAAAAYHDDKIKEALKHKRPGGRRSDHEEHDLERARHHEQSAASIRALPLPGDKVEG